MKKNIIEDERMMLRVSNMYYNKNMSQQDIADKLSISRPTISKLLAAAKENGIVTITVSDTNGRKYFQLEQLLEEKYGLKEVFIVETMEDSAETKALIGNATAQYLSRIIRDGDVIGVSMGTTAAQVAPQAANISYHSNLTFIPLIGGIGTVANELHSNYIAESMARAFGGIYYPLHAPAMISRKNTKIELLKENSIQRVFKKANRMDIAVLGIGAPTANSTIIKTGYFTSEIFNEIREQKMCGDICMIFYDENGNIDKFEFNEKIMAIDLGVLKNTKYTIGVCGGSEKSTAIIGAINGGYINVLITDYACAQTLDRSKSE